VPVNDDKAKPGRLTFRIKILLSLLGTILLITGILLVGLERETSIQIDAAIQAAMVKSQVNYLELENTWKVELGSLCGRYSSSPRILGALDAALEDADPSVLVEAAEYETKLAGLSDYLILLFNPQGRILCTLLEGRSQTGHEAEHIPVQGIATEEASFDYIVFKDHLYAIHTESLNLFNRMIGYLQIGLPLREKLVQNVGKWVDGHVSFIVNSRSIISTPGIESSALLDEMKMAAGKNLPVTVTFSGQPWAVFPELLNARKPEEGSMVYAIPLDKTLEPFRRIRYILILTALGGTCIAVILAFLLSKGLTAPIQELVKGTDRIARGHFDFKVDIQSRDEVGMLGRAFNSMVDGLNLKEKYRDLLDKVVSPEIASEMLKSDLFLGGENRVVTTLFADVRGFTAMIAAMDPRDIIALLNEYLEGAGAAIEAEGGVIDKFVGDEIMALFGAPLSRPDDALRAIQAAIRIQEMIRSLNDSRRATGKPEITIGIGINTGLVVAGNMGSRKRLNYTVLGEPVNLAARLCSMAEAGQILISASTLEQAGPGIETEALQPVLFKGLNHAVPVWIVKGLKSPMERKTNA
jgi:class 3 adenylate cyclase